MIPLEHYVLVSAGLFILGIAGVILRRNALIIYMSLEMILNASNLAMVAFSRYHGNLDGQIFVFFTIAVAAAEVAVGLAIIAALFRVKQTVRVSDLSALKL
ncbi:MAG: NADH-quinone oxidoreductase subunit NuoK [Verrucomicrobia bacterium]|nr:NADH-quinone oxidoreductase subunit NuoK [Verrucomicrobiota bacterium]